MATITSRAGRALGPAVALVVVGLVAPLVASGRIANVAGNWSQVGGNSRHTGASRDTSIAPAQVSAVTVASQFQAPGSPAVPPAVSHGMLYVPIRYGAGGAIQSGPASAETSGTGSLGGLYPTSGTIDDEPIVNNSRHRLWVIDSGGNLVGFPSGCSSAPCPASIARAHVGGCPTACSASPVAHHGVIVAATSDGSLAAYRADCSGTCLPLWRAAIGARAHSTPSIAEGRVYVGSSGGSVLVFSLDCGSGGATCAPLWHVPSGDTSANVVAIDRSDEIAFWTSADGNLYGSYGCAARGSDPACGPRIVVPLGSGSVAASPVIDEPDGDVIVTLTSGVVEAFRIARCSTTAACALTLVWSTTLPSATGTVSPSLADGVLWIGDESGYMHALSAAGCGAAACGELPIRPTGLQLESGGTDGIQTEVAAGAVWAVGSAPATYGSAPSYLLTSIVPS